MSYKKELIMCYRKMRIFLRKMRILYKRKFMSNKKIVLEDKKDVLLKSKKDALIKHKAEKMLVEMRSDWNYSFTIDEEAIVIRKMVSIWMEEQAEKHRKNELENQLIMEATRDMYFA